MQSGERGVLKPDRLSTSPGHGISIRFQLWFALCLCVTKVSAFVHSVFTILQSDAKFLFPKGFGES